MHRSRFESLFCSQLCLATLTLVACATEGETMSGPPDDEFRGGGGEPIACEPVDLDPRRAIFETNVTVLEPFTLQAVLHHAAKNAGYKSTPVQTYQRIIDTYATAENGRFPAGQHCDDELPDPAFSNPNCGVLGCDPQFFCAAHDVHCFSCNAEGTVCLDSGLPPGEHQVCGFENGFEICTFDGEQVTDCMPVQGDECDQAGCDPLGCDARQFCDPSFELCITCTGELDQCRVDQGAPDEPVERVCDFLDGCDFDVDAGTVSNCGPDPACEEAICGPLGCDREFLCTSDFEFCFECTAEGDLCELFGQPVPSPSEACNFSTGELCTFDQGTISACGPDVEGVCFGGGGESDVDTGAVFIVSDVTTDPTFGGEEVGGSEVSEVGGDPSFPGTDGGDFGTVSFGEESFSDVDTGGFVTTFGTFDEGGETTFGEGGSFEEGGESEGGEGEGGGGPGFGAIHGYPLECPRIEANQIDNIEAWFPISINNRLDLAPADGAHCGQQRIVFGNNAQNRMLMIFEAQIPNPHPECGIEACRPVVEFWARMNDIDDPLVRQEELKRAFFKGHPDLEAAGFGPFVNAEHYSFGTGQVRTNNFDDSPWTLREFKLVEHPVPGQKSRLRAVQVPVAYSPAGDHWNDALDTPHGPECRASFLEAIEGLITDEPNAMHFDIADECKAAESRDDQLSNFALQLQLGTGEFEDAITARLAELGSTLTPIDIANRARFAGACIGCHEQSNGEDLGNGVTAPFSAGFTHTVEFFTQPCGPGQECFVISDALESSFLPHRKQVMEQFLASTPCEGAACTTQANIDDTGVVDVMQALMPDGRLDVQVLLALEKQARANGAALTIGGQSTKATH